MQCSGPGTTLQDGSSLIAYPLFFSFFFSPCQVDTQNFSCFPAESKSFLWQKPNCSNTPCYETQPQCFTMQYCSTANKVKWHKSMFPVLGIDSHYTVLNTNMEIKPNIFIHQTECSNFHLRDNNAYMPKCDIKNENLGLTVKAAVLKLVFYWKFHSIWQFFWTYSSILFLRVVGCFFFAYLFPRFPVKHKRGRTKCKRKHQVQKRK